MELNESIDILKSLADATRLMIVNCLLDRPHYVEELARRLDLADSTISFHLRKMEKAGLVMKRKEQYYVTYHIDPSIFGLTLQELLCFKNVEAVVQEERIRKYREKILKNFFCKGKLVKLPAQKKKRRLVLEELVKRFDTNRSYSEKEVNYLINQSFEDHCTIRRLMVVEGLMTRKEGRYQRYEAVSDKAGKVSSKSKRAVLDSNKSKEQPMPDIRTRKELKAAYLEQGPSMGVYLIKNIRNNRCLIGYSRNVTGSLNSHRFQLKYGNHRNEELQADWRALGEEAFTFKVLDEIKPSDSSGSKISEDLAELEALWREKLKIDADRSY